MGEYGFLRPVFLHNLAQCKFYQFVAILFVIFEKVNVDKYILSVITVHIVLQMLQIMNFF